MNFKAIAILIVVLTFLTTAYFYPLLPATIVSHFGLNGQANGYASKDSLFLIMPTLILAIFALFLVLPEIDPLKKNYKAFQNEYNLLMVLIAGFLYYVFLTIIAYNLGFVYLGYKELFSPALGVLFFYLGVIIEKAKQNWFVGIRTPWTLSSKKVWDKTHKVCGKLFKIVGVIALLGVFDQIFLAISIALLILTAIFSVVYSYAEFQKEKTKKKSKK
jgi:uncharacterized membrane protein